MHEDGDVQLIPDHRVVQVPLALMEGLEVKVVQYEIAEAFNVEVHPPEGH